MTTHDEELNAQQADSQTRQSKADKRAVPRIGAAAPFSSTPPGGQVPMVTEPAVTRPMTPNELVQMPAGSFEPEPKEKTGENDEDLEETEATKDE